MRFVATSILFLVFLVGVVVLCTDVPLPDVVRYSAIHPFIGVGVLAGALITSTVVAPIAALPLVPVAATLFGPALTGVVAIISWTVGGTIAFLIARYGGRPLLTRFVDLTALSRYEKQLDGKTRFLLLVMLRMVVPVDVLSYALGFMSSVRLGEFIASTLLGVAWFAFAFSYLGSTLLERNYVLFGGISVASVIILMACWLYVRRTVEMKDGQK